MSIPVRRSCVVALAASLAWPIAAGSQTTAPARCGPFTTILRDDTLSRIAQRCDVSESVLLGANPRVRDSEDLQVGAALRIKPSASSPAGTDGAAARLDELASRTGKALGGIAGEVGSSVDRLLNRTPALQGLSERLGLPGSGAVVPTVAIFPRSGPPGASVTVSAIGLPADAPVIVGGGPRHTAYEVLRRLQTAADGSLDATVTVPDWAAGGEAFVFVVAGIERDLRVRSEPFALTAAGPAPLRLPRP